MNILLSNDDGFSAEGIQSLYKVLSHSHNVKISAPLKGKSAISQSITLSKPVIVHKINNYTYAVDGTPADSVILGLKVYFPDAEVVIAGINHGPNMGEDVFYSGTVAAAREGALNNRKAIAISLYDTTDLYNAITGKMNSNIYEHTAKLIKPIIEKLLTFEKKGIIFNINIPATKKINGIKITKQGKRKYIDPITPIKDPFGRDYFWLVAKNVKTLDEENTDFFEVREGKNISITPINLNYTDIKSIKPVKELIHDIRLNNI